jgi:hypothetical protein
MAKVMREKQIRWCPIFRFGFDIGVLARKAFTPHPIFD